MNNSSIVQKNITVQVLSYLQVCTAILNHCANNENIFKKLALSCNPLSISGIFGYITGTQWRVHGSLLYLHELIYLLFLQ